MAQLTEFLKKVYLFESLGVADLQWLSGIGRVRDVGAGDTIFFEGAAAGSFFVVRQGTVELTVRGQEDDQVVATLGAGSMLGEMGLVSGAIRSATATARENTILVEFLYSEIESRASADSRFGMQLYRAMAAQLSKRIFATTHSLAAVKDLKLRHN